MEHRVVGNLQVSSGVQCGGSVAIEHSLHLGNSEPTLFVVTRFPLGVDQYW